MGKFEEKLNPDDEEMTVTLDLEDGPVTCAIVTIFNVGEQDYIALLPLDENGQNEDGEVWFYRYWEDENDPNVEPVLDYIDDDDEYEYDDEDDYITDDILDDAEVYSEDDFNEDKYNDLMDDYEDMYEE